MFRKIGISLLCASALFSTKTMAMNHELAPGISIEYELLPNFPEIFTNYTIWTIKAICTIQTPEHMVNIHVRGINRSGAINDKVINAGDELDLLISNGEQFTLTAKSVAQVEMTNKGHYTIKALCKTI